MLLYALLACHAPADSDSDTDVANACDVTPDGKVHLPADDAVHDETVEWWYWTGHLADDGGHRYGFEETFFAFQLGSPATSGHYALTDVDGGTFDYDVTYVDGRPPTIAGGFDLTDGQGHAVGGDGHDVLHGGVASASWDLTLDAVDPPVLQHGDGYTDYESGGYTYYYSRERIDVAGTLHLGGDSGAGDSGAGGASDVPVTGSAWFDHQWGNLVVQAALGWDWYGIQLDDGREIMLFLTKGGGGVIGGSITDAGCHTTEIDPADLQVTPIGTWTSPHTGCTYAAGWDVRLAHGGADGGDLALTVTPLVADQELANDYNTYWEGASAVTGDVTGRAYVELAGACN